MLWNATSSPSRFRLVHIQKGYNVLNQRAYYEATNAKRGLCSARVILASTRVT